METRTPEQEAKAIENEKITADAHRMAAEHRAREVYGKPLIVDVADSILAKLGQLPPEGEQQ